MDFDANYVRFLLILVQLASCLSLPLTQDDLDSLLAKGGNIFDKAENFEKFERQENKNQGFEIVFPHELKRSKRDIDESGTKEISFNAFGQDIHLSLQQTTTLLSENFVIQRTHKNGTSSLQAPKLNCLYAGRSLNHDVSRAFVSQCTNEAEMFGHINLGEQDIIIKPKTESSLQFKGQDEMKPHYAFLSESKKSGECSSNDEEGLERNRIDIQSLETDEDILPATSRKCLEINVVVDNTVAEEHGSHTENFLLSLMNSVFSLFNDESLGNSLCLILKKVQILEGDVSGLSITSDIETSLGSFCYWQREEDTDVSVLITRKDLAYGNIFDITGDSVGVGKACNPSSRCAIAEYNGPSGLIFTISHEIGHLVGMRHDVGNCKEESGEKIMASRNSGGPNAFRWSACSRMYLDDWLRTDQASCLEDMSSSRKLHSFREIPMTGNHLDADQQCRLIYGEGAKAYQPLKNTKEICEELKCEVENSGEVYQTNHIPPLDGTSCGQYQSQQCFKGYCMDFYSKFDCGTGDCPNQYSTSDWSSCNSDCLQSRVVTCVAIQDDSTEVIVDESECIAEGLDKPDSTECCCAGGSCIQGVTDPSPPTGFLWVATAWGSCMGICGTGVEERVVTCFSGATFTRVEPESLCGVEPPEERACDLSNACDATTTSAPVTYEWFMGAYGTCTGTCGIGSQTRLVICIISNTNQLVDDSFCPGSKPATSQSCDTGIACTTTTAAPITVDGGTYLFLAGTWGQCSVTCGVGVETRPVGCVRIAPPPTNVVSDDICFALGQTKPDEQQDCVLDSCPGEQVYVYVTGDWSSCSVTCGSGLETRSVYCAEEGSTTPVDESFCTGITMPPNTQACTLDDCIPVTYIYLTGTWSSCSVTCGNGLEQRSVTCINSAISQTVDDSFCEAQGLTKPDETQSCSEPTCPLVTTSVPSGNYIFFTLPWSVCNCATQTQTRTVQCVEINGGIRSAPDEECIAAGLTKPAEEQACTPTGCDCQYQVTDWSECSAQCGQGIWTRTVTCDCSGIVSDDSKCEEQGLLKPDSSEICVIEASCFAWKVIAVSGCSVTCDEGVSMQQSECYALVDDMEIKVEDTLCNVESKPAEILPCNLGVCIGIWVAGPWSDCSVTCNVGQRTRDVGCYEDKSASVMANETLCDDEKMPYSEEECNLGPCPSPYGCDMTYKALSGSLMSPEFPDYYPPNLNCDQMIELPTTIVVGSTSTPSICHLELEFDFFDLEDSMDCIFDYVMLTDVKADTSKKYCGTQLGLTYIPTGDQVRLSFKSDASVPGIGYNVSWSCVDGLPPTEALTTEALTTEAFTTEARTTEALTTEARTTEALTTETRATEARTTEAATKTTEAPMTSRFLSTPKEASTMPPPYMWLTGIFSMCSVTCGMGLQTRTVTCFNPDNNMQVEDSFCSSIEKPNATQECQMPTCPPPTVTPEPCNEGPIDVSQSIIFPSGDGDYPNDYFCTTTIVNPNQGCIKLFLTGVDIPSNSNCTQDYLELRDSVGGVSERYCNSFDFEEWTSATSTVEVEFSTDDSVAGTGYTLIVAYVDCFVTEWKTGAYGECSEICGGGNRTREVTCISSANSAVLDDGYCDASQKPASSEECNSHACTASPTMAAGTTPSPITYSWVRPENYTECDVSCGGGFKYKYAYCQDSLGNAVEDSFCDQLSKPNDIAEVCNDQPCPVFSWQITPTSECSMTCGGGNQTVNVTCVDSGGMELNDSFCDPDSMPSDVQPCNTDVSCPAACGGQVVTSSSNSAGSFSSPNYPNNYDNNTYCEVTFTIPAGYTIVFNIDLSGMADDSGICLNDYVKFSAEPSDKALQVCSGVEIFQSNIGDTEVIMLFVTNESVTGSGFTSTWELRLDP